MRFSNKSASVFRQIVDGNTRFFGLERDVVRSFFLEALRNQIGLKRIASVNDVMAMNRKVELNQEAIERGAIRVVQGMVK